MCCEAMQNERKAYYFGLLQTTMAVHFYKVMHYITINTLEVL